ncbi:hypothetical protein C8Q75DRAFT_767843 [Abortiporus biennis]|nr:hypothetical protein C8Q75DRAFT_767843 [Abortiporus biennis]
MNDITLGPSPSEHKSVFSASSSSSCLPPPCFLSGLSRDMVPGLGQSVWSPHQVHSTTSLATDSFYNPLTKPNLPSLQSIPRSIYGFPRSVIPGLDFSIWSPRLPATESKIPRTPITFLAPPELSEFESQLPATPSYSALGLAITSALTRCRQEVPSFPSVSNLPAPPTSIPQQFLRIPFASFVKALMERQLWFCQHFSSRMAFL